MTTSRAWFDWANVRPTGVADVAGMLWAERALVLGLGGVICALGLVAALAAPKAYAARAELMVVTLLIASIVAIGAGLSRALARRPVLAALRHAANAMPPEHAKAPRPARKGKPHLVLVQGGA